MAAHKQGKFWEYHDKLFENMKALEDADLEKYAQEVGLDVEKWKADFASPEIAAQVAKQNAACVKVGASGTPAFFVQGRKLSGAKPFEEFKTVIEEELKKAKALVDKGTPRDEVYEKVLKDARKNRPSQLTGAVQRFDLDEAPIMGPQSAVATIVVFSDFECPFCSRIGEPIEEAMKELPGQVRVAFKHFPLTSIHPNAKPAAIASMAAQEQGKFWEYHDLLFQNQKRLTRPDLVRWAGVVGLDVDKFEKDLSNPAFEARLRQDIVDAGRAGVSGTPSVFINGRKLKTAPTSAEALVDVIKTEILQIHD